MTVKQALKECQVFAGLTNAELEKIAGLAVETEYEAGAIIFREEDSAEEFFVLQEGKVALQVTLPAASPQVSKRVTVYYVTKDEVLDWSAIVEPHIHTLAAMCLQKTKLLAISGSRLRVLLRDNHHLDYEMLKGLIKVVASRLNETGHVLASERLLTP